MSTEQIIRLEQVKQRTGLSRSTIYEYIDIGFFPRPILLGKRAVGWVDSEISAWIAERIAKSRNVSPASSSVTQ